MNSPTVLYTLGNMDQKSELARLLAEYRHGAVEWGGELLLRPGDALRLVDDVERLGVAVLGADGWHYTDRAKGWIVEEPEADLAVPESILQEPDVVRRSAEAARDFIRNRLTPATEFVSLVLDTPGD
jgi:hypothetical protein